MQMKVRRSLPAIGTIVLKQENAQRIICLDESTHQALSCNHYFQPFVRCEVYQCSRMSTRHNYTLPDLELLC